MMTQTEKTKPTTIALAKLTLDPRLQPRKQMDDDVIRAYADEMQRGDTFPPIRVIAHKECYYVVDGFHRVKALQGLKRTEVSAEITAGTFEDAEDYVMTVNRTHGLRRTQADVQNAIERALLTERWQQRSDNWISKHIGCSDKTVSALRTALEATSEIPKLKTLVGEDGKVRRRSMLKAKPTPVTKKTIDDPAPVQRPVGVSSPAPANDRDDSIISKPANDATPGSPSTTTTPAPPPLNAIINLVTLKRELRPLLDGLKAEGKKNMATMSPGTVAYLTAKLEKRLDELAHAPTPSEKLAQAVQDGHGIVIKELSPFIKELEAEGRKPQLLLSSGVPAMLAIKLKAILEKLTHTSLPLSSKDER